MDDLPRSLGDRLQAAFDWAGTASVDPPEGGPSEGGPSAEQLTSAARALRQAAGQPEDRARVIRLLEPVARSITDGWPWDDELGLEILQCLALARDLASREGSRPS